MSNESERILRYLQQAARDNFKTVDLRTYPMTPDLAATVLRRIPADENLDPVKVADHLGKLPRNTGDGVRLQRSTDGTVLTISVPGDRMAAVDWANEFIERMSASRIKMNLGPDKATDMKVFWGKPDINTLIEGGGED